MERKTVSVAVMISVCENPVIISAPGPVQCLYFFVVLAIQRRLTYCLILEQLHLILKQYTRCYDNEEVVVVGFISRHTFGFLIGKCIIHIICFYF